MSETLLSKIAVAVRAAREELAHDAAATPGIDRVVECICDELEDDEAADFRQRCGSPPKDNDQDYPDYPCPRDPDGLHSVGCGCEF